MELSKIKFGEETYDIKDEQARDALAGKQDRLVAGENIAIDGNVISAQGGGGMEFYEVTLERNAFFHDGRALTYADLVARFNDPKSFLYLKYLNLIFIPSIETDDALAFSSAWTRREDIGESDTYPQPYISRVIINADGMVRSEQTGMQATDLILDSMDDYEETYGAKMYPSAKAVHDAIETLKTPQTFDIGFGQETVDTVVFPTIDYETAIEIYEAFVGGTPVLIKWTLLNMPIEFAVIGSDNAINGRTFDIICHDTYLCSYTIDDSDLKAHLNVTNLAGGGGTKLYAHMAVISGVNLIIINYTATPLTGLKAGEYLGYASTAFNYPVQLLIKTSRGGGGYDTCGISWSGQDAWIFSANSSTSDDIINWKWRTNVTAHATFQSDSVVEL